MCNRCESQPPTPSDHEIEKWAEDLENAKVLSERGAGLLTLMSMSDVEFYKPLGVKLCKAIDAHNLHATRLPALTPVECRQVIALACYGAARFHVAVMRGLIHRYEQGDAAGGIRITETDASGR